MRIRSLVYLCVSFLIGAFVEKKKTHTHTMPTDIVEALHFTFIYELNKGQYLILLKISTMEN